MSSPTSPTRSPVARSEQPSATGSSAEIKRQLPGSETVPTRPMEFDRWIDDLPKYFAADGDIVMSHILAVLSSVFPDGEDFFVRSVRAVADEISDPNLIKDVEGFIGQESMHGREHRVLNDKLAELGYPAVTPYRSPRASGGCGVRRSPRKKRPGSYSGITRSDSTPTTGTPSS